MSASLAIRLDDTLSFGEVEATDEDRAAYERAVANAIAEAFPGADVTVQCLQIDRPRAVVTTRGADGRILCDVETARAEEAIAEAVLHIARDVWDLGEFWTDESRGAVASLAIRLDYNSNWDGVVSTDEDRAAYEQAVADAIARSYPGADVTVQCVQRRRSRVLVTTRVDGRILRDAQTVLAEEAIAESVLHISRDVWELQEFWTDESRRQSS